MFVEDKQIDGIFDYCYNPSLIKNKYDGKKYSVSCRYCPSCLSQRSSRLVQMLANEFKFGPYRQYAVFVTFTYAAQFLPMFYRTVNDDGTLSPFYISDFGQVIPAKLIDEDSLPRQDFADFELHIKNHPKYVYKAFASFNVKDLQNTFKRLRITLSRKFGYSSDAFRYFFVSEFGSKRFRPHYHGFIWCKTKEVQDFIMSQFDTSKLCQSDKLRKSLSSLWSRGLTDAQIPNSDEATTHYISGYISNLSNSVNFRVKGFRPFYICSKNPFIGSNPREVSSLFAGISSAAKSLGFVSPVYDTKSSNQSAVTHILYSSSACFTLLPKCTGFAALSRSERVAKYGLLYGRPNYEVAYFKDYSSESSVSLYGVVDGNVYSSLDIHCMRVCSRICLLLNITPLRYVELLTDFYTRKSSFLLGMLFDKYNACYQLDGSLMYYFKSCPELFYDYQYYVSRGKSLPSDLVCVLQSIFGSDIPSFDDVFKYVSIDYDKDVYIERTNLFVQSSVKHRFENEVFNKI